MLLAVPPTSAIRRKRWPKQNQLKRRLMFLLRLIPVKDKNEKSGLFVTEQKTIFIPQGQRIGWKKLDNLYFEPKESLASTDGPAARAGSAGPWAT